MTKPAGSDETLLRLLDLARPGMAVLDLPIVVVAGGQLVRGRLASELAYADWLDETLARSLDAADAEPGAGEAPLSGLRDLFRLHPFSVLEAEAVRRTVSSGARAPETSTDGPGDAPRVTSFALSGASVFVAAVGWREIGWVRITTDHVSAWWIPGAEEGSS